MPLNYQPMYLISICVSMYLYSHNLTPEHSKYSLNLFVLMPRVSIYLYICVPVCIYESLCVFVSVRVY